MKWWIMKEEDPHLTFNQMYMMVVSEGAGTGVSLLPEFSYLSGATLTLTMADGSRQVTGIQFSSTEVIEATVNVVLERWDNCRR